MSKPGWIKSEETVDMSHDPDEIVMRKERGEKGRALSFHITLMHYMLSSK